MILLVHMLFGAAAGSLTQNPLLGVLLAFLSHYFLDLFPHIEYLESTETSIKSRTARDMAKVFLDLAFGAILVFLFSNHGPMIYLYAFTGIVPDGLTVVTHIFPNKWLEKHHQFHGGKIHYLTKQKKFPVFWKITTQVVAVAASIYLLSI